MVRRKTQPNFVFAVKIINKNKYNNNTKYKPSCVSTVQKCPCVSCVQIFIIQTIIIYYYSPVLANIQSFFFFLFVSNLKQHNIHKTLQMSLKRNFECFSIVFRTYFCCCCCNHITYKCASGLVKCYLKMTKNLKNVIVR